MINLKAAGTLILAVALTFLIQIPVLLVSSLPASARHNLPATSLAVNAATTHIPAINTTSTADTTYDWSHSIVFPLDEGKRAIVLGFETANFRGYIADTTEKRILQNLARESPIFDGSATRYTFQNNSLILAPLRGNTALIQIKSDGSVVEMLPGSDAPSEFFNAKAIPCAGQLSFLAENEDESLSYVNIKDAKVSVTNIVSDERFSTPPSHLNQKPFYTFYPTNACEHWELFLADKANAAVSGATSADGTYSVFNGDPHITHRRDNDQTAKLHETFLKTINLDPANLLEVEPSSPSEIYYKNLSTGHLGEKLETPTPLYHGLITHLNAAEVLLLGSPTEHTQDAPLNGYIFNNKTRELTDVNPMLSNYAYSDALNRPFFYKDATSPYLYSAVVDKPGRVWNIDTSETKELHAQEIAKYTPAAQTETDSDPSQELGLTRLPNIYPASTVPLIARSGPLNLLITFITFCTAAAFLYYLLKQRSLINKASAEVHSA